MCLGFMMSNTNGQSDSRYSPWTSVLRGREPFRNGVREELPGWLAGIQETWKTWLDGQIPKRIGWKDLPEDEAKNFPLSEELISELKKALNTHSFAHGRESLYAQSETYEEQLPNPGPNFRYRLELSSENPKRGIDLGWGLVLKIQKYYPTRDPNGRGMERNDAYYLSKEVRCWIAAIEGVKGSCSVLLLNSSGENFSSPGPVKIWTYGVETILVLPVAAALVDPSWSELPYIVGFALHKRKAFPATRQEIFPIGQATTDLSY